jgi:hypothetical protein
MSDPRISEKITIPPQRPRRERRRGPTHAVHICPRFSELFSDPALLRKPLNPFLLDHRMNLIPEASGLAPNYWCTWNLQEYVANESHGKANIRNILSEDFLLGDDGWAKKMFPLVRGDLYLLLDDGWDIPKIPDGGPEVQKLHMRDYLSSFMLDPSKWSRFQGDPAERLRVLNDAVKKEGWKGIGLWVAAQEARAPVELLARTVPVVQGCQRKVLEGRLGHEMHFRYIPKTSHQIRTSNRPWLARRARSRLGGIQ